MDGQRQMFQGDWNCSGCGTPIKELPFEPRSTENLNCRDCYSKNAGPRIEKKMFQGSWSCAGCTGPITELPFEPRDQSNLKCRDCFKKEKGFA